MTIVCIQKSTYPSPEIERLLAPLGGMASFVEKGDRVLLKVNLLSAREPEKAVTTHPEVVRAVAQSVKEAGGIPYIGDSPSGKFSERALRKAYKRSGLEDIANEEGIPLNRDTGTRRLDIPDGVRLKQTSVCNFVLETDKIIALPKLKTHSLQYMTLACKIMYGAIPGLTKAKYHAQFPRRAAFADMLLDITMFIKPGLFIMDGIVGMQGQGPGSGDPVNLGWLLASTDPVAMDIAVCRLVGIEPVAIPALKRAKVRKLWPEDIEYPILAPEDTAYQEFKLPNTTDYLLTGKKTPKKSPMVTEKCIACGDCEEICPKDAVQVKDDRASVDYSKCIRCFCCHEVCPEKAIDLVAAKKR
ncbi:MAG: DUF362 domain-containing protein [Desulfobacterales bacterium]|uniref:DUF362 domain-containing protein n=1 Tax=Candidatus Desulfatibia vada TaxID=2841696 RepID=A0A8J6P0Q1_9BACT|nr:DUF362 domain-containing protein [Candidatus Desulfatibia vada]